MSTSDYEKGNRKWKQGLQKYTLQHMMAAAVGEKSENYNRYSLLLQEATDVIHTNLGKHFTISDPSIFFQELTIKKSSLKPLKGKIIKEEQWKLLFPKSKQTLIENIDITLSMILFRSPACKISPPAAGWKKDEVPKAKNISFADDLVRVRIERNNHSHNATREMETTDLTTKWAYMEIVLIRLGSDPVKVKNLWSLYLDNRVLQEIKDKNALQDRVDFLEDKLDSNWYRVPDALSCFTGRDDVLQDIHKSFQNGSNTVVLTGFGGIGKTQIATTYAATYGASDYANNVIWIGSDGNKQLSDEFINLAEDLRLTIHDNGELIDISNIIGRVYKFFGDRKSLFIFDNVNSCEEVLDFLPHLPPDIQSPSVLITSQFNEWGSNYKVIEIDLFSDDTAKSFITDFVPEHLRSDPKGVEVLHKNLENLPLALHTAVSYIKKNEMPIDEYNESLNSEMEKLMDIKVDEPYSKTVLKTWDIALQKLRAVGNDNAIKLITLLAFMDNKSIKKSFLKNLELSTVDLNTALTILSQYSLISRNGDDICIHLLIQYVIRVLHLSAEDGSRYRVTKWIGEVFTSIKAIQQQEYPRMLLQMVRRCLEGKGKDVRFDDGIWLPHIMSLFQICKGFEGMREIHDELLELVPSLYDAFQKKGQYSSCFTLFSNMLLYFNKIYEENELSLLYNLRNCIALTLLKMGQLEDAFKMMEGLVEDYKVAVGETHSSTVLMKINLVSALVDRGYIERAIIILDDITNAAQYHLIDIKARTIAQELKGNTLLLQGRYSESLEVFKKLKKEIIDNFQTDDPRMYSVMFNEANCYFYLGKYKESLQFFEITKAFAIKIYQNEKHQNVHLAKRSIGKCYHRLNQLDEALTIFDEALNGLYECYDERHPDYLSAENFKVLCLLEYPDEIVKTKKLAEDNLIKRVQVIGKDHQYTLVSKAVIGYCLMIEGKFDEARRILEETLEEQVTKLGEKHTDVIDTQFHLGKCYIHLNRLDEARYAICNVYTLQCKTLGDDHPSTQKTKKIFDEIDK